MKGRLIDMKWLSGVLAVALVVSVAMLSGCTKAEEPMEESTPQQEMSQPAEPAAPPAEEPAAPMPEEPAPANP